MAAWTGSQTIIFWEYHTFNDGTRRNLWNQAYGGAGTWTHEGGYDINYFYGNSGGNNSPYTALNSSTTIGTTSSKTVVGTTINLTATTVNTLFGTRNSLSTIIIITGRDSGARLTIPVTITKVTQ